MRGSRRAHQQQANGNRCQAIEVSVVEDVADEDPEEREEEAEHSRSDDPVKK